MHGYETTWKRCSPARHLYVYTPIQEHMWMCLDLCVLLSRPTCISQSLGSIKSPPSKKSSTQNPSKHLKVTHTYSSSPPQRFPNMDEISQYFESLTGSLMFGMFNNYEYVIFETFDFFFLEIPSWVWLTGLYVYVSSFGLFFCDVARGQAGWNDRG